ncbi:MAG: hypothetical protein DRP62_04485 [Planctomycetota bacterium]|nr:MAG: hypothetical protein DRP62_04485 [Planctomycetota bacterium]
MSNRVDLLEPTQRQLALPASRVSVLLDGELCPYLELREIVRSGWPEFSRAHLIYNPAAYAGGGLAAIEEIEPKLGIGKTVCVRQVYNAGYPGASADSFAIFVGQIDQLDTKLDADSESVEIVARDFSAQLKRITIYGQQVGNADGSALFLAGSETVFNKDGKPNATTEQIKYEGNSLTLFAAEPSAGKFWSYAEAIDYLLRVYLPDGQLQTPSVERLEALTEGQTARHLDVTGLNLADALRRCCERIGLKFKFVPLTVPVGGEQAIVFYRNGAGRAVELNCQPAGEQLCVSKTTISSIRSRKNFWPITHRYIGQGDFKIYEATFELVKAWDSGLEDTDYDKFSPSTNPDFHQVKDVYRKWSLNEAGDYSGEPYNQGAAFDFSKIFGNGNFAQHRRRFWPTLTADKKGQSLGYFLQVSFDNGIHWWQYLAAFNNLLDECGIWLSSDRLDVDTWVAALKGVLKFRITASVSSDEKLSCTAADGPINSSVPVVDHIITLGRQFKYRRISAKSIFADSSDESLGKPDEVDDSSALYEYVRKKALMSPDIVETINVQMPYTAFDYQTGDRVSTSPESRDLLGVKSDSRSRSWIEQVQMDFEKQCTNLKIVRKRGNW